MGETLCPHCYTPRPAGLPTCPVCDRAGAATTPAPRADRRPLVVGAVAAGFVGLLLLIVANSGDAPPAADPPPETAAAGEQSEPVPPAAPGGPPLAWRFAYDADGLPAEVVNPAGVATRFRYERDDRRAVRKVVRAAAGGAVTLEFDAAGRRAAMTDAAGRVAYDYDGFGRLAAVTRAGAPPVRYAYDDAGRVASVAVGDDHSVGYEYDYLGRRAAVVTPAGRVTFRYSAADRSVARELPNGVVTTWRYGADGTLARVEHAAGGRVVAAFAHQYRPDGLIREVKETTPDGEHAVAYEYDTVGRLTAAADSRGPRWEYHYDALGNRVKLIEGGRPAVESRYDWFGRVTEHRGARCEHDAAGGLTRYPGGKGPTTLTYTADGQLASAAVGGAAVACRYDGDGNLVGRDAAGAATAFVADPLAAAWRPLLATGPGGERTAYLWDGDAPLAERVNGEWRFFLTDHRSSVRGVVDARGAVVARPEYCPFGTPVGEAAGFRPGFAGHFFDAAAGLYLTRARAYDPALGRFLTPDPQHRVPAGSQKDLIAYVYCGNDPVNFTDPDGCEPRRPYQPPAPVPSVFQFFTPVRTASNFAVNLVRAYNMKSELFAETTNKFGHNSGNDVSDAWRHARWNERMTRELGPGVAFVAGVGHEFTGFFDPGSLSERIARARMDLHNNREGRSGMTADQLLASGRLVTSLDAAKPYTPFSTYSPTSGAASGSGGTARRDVGPSPGTGNLTLLAIVDPRTIDGIRSLLRELGTPGPGNPSVPRIRDIINRTPDAERWLFNPPPPPPPGGSTPAPVGGVALAGAAAALDGFGQLDGVAVDDHGRLVLLARDRPGVQLPPLRLDDVVTVFRAVYDHGEAPSVSIDPDPADPHGPVMLIRHGRGTANTYVGWVLFEADRVMKVYSLTQDNLTGRPFRSAVSGFDEHRRLLFAGGPAANRPELWERFWIVPAAATHRTAADGTSALTRVPLRLRTEAMVMGKDGKLAPAPAGQSSAGARYFTDWFTKNYDAIARESRSRTPAGSGRDTEVPVFAELERVAVVAAVAERLRDRGVPMPGWMRDYPVAPFPFAATTPATTASEGRYKVYGGVQLAPPREAVQSIPDEQADAVVAKVRAAVGAAPALAAVALPGGGTAAALPPAGALGVGANRLAETDLTVPLPGGDLRLVRRFDSSHAPADDGFGPGWTLDLPRLDQRRGAPGEKANTYRTALELSSPLDTVAGRFADIKAVPEANGQLLVPTVPGESLGFADSTDLGAKTKLLLFRDGRRWHFDKAGRLVATIDGPRTVRFERDAAGRLRKIEGAAGADRADVRLEYDAGGRVARAVGSDGRAAAYAYDAAGRLQRVTRPGGATGYEYAGPRVSAVLADGEPPRRFEYGPGGRLTRESVGDAAVRYEVTAGPAGTRVVAAGPGGADVAEYDGHFRPVRHAFADGSAVDWRYAADGAVDVKVAPAGGRPWEVRRSAGGRREEYVVPGEEPRTAEFDAAGRLREVRRAGQRVLSVEWRADGRPAAETDATTTRRYTYHPDGTPAGVAVGPAGGAGRGVEVALDAAGRPAAVTDESGAVTKLSYAAGGLTGATGPGGGVTVRRGADGRPAEVTATWGRAVAIEYEAGGGVRRAEERAAGAAAVVEFAGGRPTRAVQFDGGEWRVEYPARPAAPPQRVRTPNGLEVRVEADDRNRPTAVLCGAAYRVEYDYDAADRLTGLRFLPVPGAGGR